MLSTRSSADVDKWYDEIRAKIRTRANSAEDHGPGLVIALTSMKSGEGVTTAALGLAKSFERESCGSVLMILAKETPGEFDFMPVGVKPRVIGDDLLFASAGDPERDQSEPYLALPTMPEREPPSVYLRPNETADMEEEPTTGIAAVVNGARGQPAEDPEDASDVELPRDVIERLGGIRPMARAMNVPASTVASWKRRGRIPRHRRHEIAVALGESALAQGWQPEVDSEVDESANQLVGPGSGLGDTDEQLARQLLDSGGLRAAEVIDFFDGAEALANALDMPTATVQVWEAENRIPDLYHATIRLAARDRGGSLGAAELPPPSGPAQQKPPRVRRRNLNAVDIPSPSPSTRKEGRPRDRRPSMVSPETKTSQASEDVLPVWQPDAARPDERFIVSMGEAGPHVMAIGTRGLNGSGYGRRWENTFRQLRETYGVIIVDASSLETPIPKIWRDQTSQNLLVIDSTKTTANELRRMSRLTDLSSLRLSGTILNKTVR